MKETVENEYEIENLGSDWRVVNRLTRQAYGGEI